MSARIVLAEDEPDIRQNLQRLLRLEGYEVWAGCNGQEALTLVREHRPDLVISDVMMPEMTGHELTRALRADPQLSHLPVILLTARADHQDVREGMNLGADDYLTKPFQRSELLQSISSRLEKAAAQQRRSQQLAAQHQHRAHHDAVTELPNRSHFLLLLQATLQNSARQGLNPLLLGVGLDNLPQMMQMLPTGDMQACVACMGQRMRGLAAHLGTLTGGHVILARTAEDRFVFLLDRCSEEHRTVEWLHPVWQACSEPIDNQGERHFPKISVGSLWMDSERSAPELVLARLDTVLSQAQRQPARPLCAHSLQSSDELRTEFRLHNALHEALPRQQLHAAFQPQVNARTRGLVGFEALMRWNHPEWGAVPPARFIPLAEDNGQIVPMGEWMLQEACTAAAQWAQGWQGADPVPRVAVNLSLRQFGHPDLVRHVEQALAHSGLRPHLLELEVTEGTAMLDLTHTLQLLNRFKSMGLKLAIDDFGTGYSSLAYLKRFPLDVLKVDQSFVRNLCTDAEDRAIANAVIQLAHSLDMEVIAEGVETEQQLDILLDMGCDLCQGYLFGKPVALSESVVWASQGGGAVQRVSG
jgi:diguanylate cyclase